MKRFRALVAFALILAAGGGATAPLNRPDLFGTFVGRAEEIELPGNRREVRDIDIIIRPNQPEGLKINWTNVTLVDGRRDVPGVKRRSDEVILIPAPDRSFYLAGAGYDPFHKRSQPDPVAGDPLRWAVLDGDTLNVYSFIILEDGRYELQTYTRRTTPEGLALAFERRVDGALIRQMTGRAVRAE